MAVKTVSELGVTKTDAYFIDPNKLVIIADKNHPQYDPRAEIPLNENMVQTILDHGVREPIEVRKIDENTLEVVNGRQRTKACREANRRLQEANPDAPIIKIRFIFCNEDDVTTRAIATLTNCVKIDETLWERIVNFNRNLNDFGMTMAKACQISDISLMTGHLWKKAVDMPKKLQHMVASGKIALAAALDLAKHEDWQEKLEALQSEGKVYVSRVRKAVATGDCQRHRVLTYKKLETVLEERKDLNPEVVKAIKFCMGLVDEL